MNRSLPVALEDPFRRNVWGNDLAYAIDIRLLSSAVTLSGRGASAASTEAAATSPGDVLVYHKDGMGSVRAITDVAGNVIETYDTDEFGVVTCASGSVEQPFGYTGEMYDAEIARFISRDTEEGDLTSPLSMNRYAYAMDNPLRYVDPSGHAFEEDTGGAGQVGGSPTMMGGGIGGPIESGGRFGGGAGKALPRTLSSASTNDSIPQIAGGSGRAAGFNPFRGKTFREISDMLIRKGFISKGPDPERGLGSFLHPRSGRQYYLDQGATYSNGKELPHVDVARPKGSLLEKRRFPLGEKLYE